jgi:hypothetical protein
MTDMVSNNTEFRTNDMNLVATLLQHDFAAECLEYDEDVNSVFWIYLITDDLRKEVSKYSLGESRVEPQQFSRSFIVLKDEMFEFLREANPRKRDGKKKGNTNRKNNGR